MLSCACFNSVSFGIKILFKNEGTKVVLDTIISRFVQMPRNIIYDFSCGLYGSAAHTLWGALKDTTIVTDNFHYRNHSKCSPSFHPRAHSALDSANTVAHEQNNRPISEIGRSLRKCGQKTYVELLCYLVTIENIRAKARSSSSFSERPLGCDDSDIQWCYFHCLKLTCSCCSDSPIA